MSDSGLSTSSFYSQRYYGLHNRHAAHQILAKRRKEKSRFFDSGDYNMARARLISDERLPLQLEEAILHEATGNLIPTPDKIAAVRRIYFSDDHKTGHPSKLTR